MFSRGSRFPATKASEVPGPGAYDAQDPEYDAYKRGAFLEKTNRFNKDKPSEVPGPGTYNSDPTKGQNRPPTRTGQNAPTSDRLAALQRKLEDLERVHNEEKKAHHLEQERLKLELNRAQRTASEQTERADKLKKQNDVLDARVQELKKTSMAEQAELRDLRVKLRSAEHERTQLAAKQSDAAEARKAEARRKDDLRERDRKVAELEKALAAERKKREAVEARLQEVKAKTDEKVLEAQAAVEEAKSKMRVAQVDVAAVRSELQRLEACSGEAEEELLEQLEQHRYALTRVAQEYGRLASSTVALATHQQVEHEVTTLQLRANRLERKLANSDGQVAELANLIRQVKDEKAFLSEQLREAQRDVDVLRRALHCGLDSPPPSEELAGLYAELVTANEERHSANRHVQEACQSSLEAQGTLNRVQKESLLFHASVLAKESSHSHTLLDQQTQKLAEAESVRTHLSDAAQRAQAEQAEAQRQLAECTASLAESNTRADILKKELDLAREEKRAEVARVEQSLQQEKKAGERLAASLHQARQNEQFLQSEVEQLTADLAEVEKYQEAYEALLAEVDTLVDRNALAEEEARRLSAFNAEIIGHRNPAQRIQYVDRIRRELHDAKQKLLMSTRDRDAVLADNDDLRAELGLYKSVAVPHDAKPRTAITRVARTVPAASEQDLLAVSAAATPVSTSSSSLRVPGQISLSSSSARSVSSGGSASRLTSVPELPSVGDFGEDMTLDEIL